MRIGPRCDINNVPTLLIYLVNRICGLEKCWYFSYSLQSVLLFD